MVNPDPRELSTTDSAILLVIDVQGKLAEMVHDSERLRLNVGKMLRIADLFRVPVVLTEQYPRGLGGTVPELRLLFDGLATEKHLVEKTAFGCCGEAGFDELLARVAEGVRRRCGAGAVYRQPAPPCEDRALDVIVVGMETHVCVQQTVLELLRRGEHRVVVLEDATSSRAASHHRIALDRFRQCGAVVSCYESVAFEWARSKDHPLFRAMSAIVKQ